MMNLKRILNLKNKIKGIQTKNKFTYKQRKYAFFVGLAAFAMLNTGFTSQPTSELPLSQTAQTEQANEIIPSDEMKLLIAEESKNLPSGITISEFGSITLAENDNQKQLLTEVVNHTLANVGNIDDMNGIAEGEAVEEPEFIDEIEEVNPVSGFSGDDGQYASVMSMEATAYLPSDGNGAGITAMGIPATYGVAAVDPSVIPLGSRLYIPGYGEAIAADTGGAIYGYKIDLCMESYEQAMSFGRRTITVYVLR
ncbi:MAG: 3D domain-containing protein [Selenomonadaceae bacterium]|nr:3D domain-containing protein [Selenomonadaceae bacterium]